MPILLLLFALLVPRVTIAVLWLFTNWWSGLFTSALVPILGFIVLPTTLLWYSVVQRWMNGEWGILAIAGAVVALIIDLFPARKRRAMQAAA